MSAARITRDLLCIVLMLRCASAAGGVAGESGEAYLTSRGLIQRNASWLLPLEVEVQQRVQKLPKLEANLTAAENAARQLQQALSAGNVQVRIRIVTAENRIQALQAAREEVRSQGRRKVIDALIMGEQEELARLRGAWFEPERIGALPAMRQAVVLLNNQRNELSVNILRIHDARPLLRQQYAALEADALVDAALARLGEKHRLGSGEDYDSKPFLLKLAGYEKRVFTDEVPLYRDGDDDRVSGFINRTPVTFTWHGSGEPTMLTASVLEATGQTVPEDAPQIKWRFPDGGELTVRRIEIPYMRFGRHVLKDVSALALPPEGEKYGAQIGPAAFDGQTPRAEP